MTNQLDQISKGLLQSAHKHLKTRVRLNPPGWQRIFAFSYTDDQGVQQLAYRILASERAREQLAEHDWKHND